MQKVVLIKYGELTTKRGNRNFFVKTLVENVKRKLELTSSVIEGDYSRMTITCDHEELSLVLEKLHQVFGIHAYHVASVVESKLEKIEEEVLSVMQERSFQTFKIETKRSDKKFPLSSMEVSRRLGGVVLKNISGVKVDVHHPDVFCQVEIRNKNTYIYTNAYPGLGGYPVGTQPRGMLMLSGGIDSPVAGYLAMKRGIPISAVYFEALPHTSLDAREKVVTLTKKLAKYQPKINLHIVPFALLQEAIYQNCDPTYCITIMRRMMYRIMESLCKKNKAYAIINGESIGQVASQTLTSMRVINEVTNYPVIRPVSCLDKLEIIDISKKIDTYETSILPFEDCCTIFVPKHPVINPDLDMAREMEQKILYQDLIEKILKETKTITIREIEEVSDLL